MQHYDNSTYSLPLDYRNDQLIIDARREIQKKEKKNLFLDYAQPEIIDEKLAFVSSDVKMTELDQRFAANKESGKLASVSSNAGLTTWMGLQDGNSQVYLLWKQLLNKWLSTDGCKVYICTRQMDIQRYKDLSIMAYKNRLHDGLEAIYTCGRSAAGMTADKTSLLRGHSAEEQLFIEYRILNKTKLTTTKKISCNFIAGMYPRQSVELMITSATFDAEGLDKSQNLHTVSVSNMAIETFTSEFIDRLSAL
ncbi:uncharacterized protein [Watersipora subatra]|uniref:uncharacterized protein n=1 Tax=Watersipora subatra TaxID=2589382 RepID=UPI00355AF3A1